MLLGKRPRQVIRRTTSMTGIPAELTGVIEESEPSDGQAAAGEDAIMAVHQVDHRLLTSLVSPRNHHRRNVSSESFLRTCGLCNRRLVHGRDIYMYRGDTPFCSLECREKQMKKDRRKERNDAVLLEKADVDRG